MKGLKLLFGMCIVIMLVGCSMYGYETRYETDRRLCNKCINECGYMDLDIAMEWVIECENSCQDENMQMDIDTRFDFCSDSCFNQWNNRTEVLEYQKCYYAKCDWIC